MMDGHILCRRFITNFGVFCTHTVYIVQAARCQSKHRKAGNVSKCLDVTQRRLAQSTWMQKCIDVDWVIWTWWIYTHAWNCLKSKFIINIIFLYIHNYTWYFEIWDMCVVCDECYDDVMIQANRDFKDWMDRLVWIATTGKLLQDRLWLDRSGLVVVPRLVRLMSCWKGRRVYWQVV